MATKNYAAAMLDVLETFMEEDPHFAVMGNEVLGIGPQALQFEPFQRKYGDRIYFPPCSEAAFAALAAGAAMCGQRIFAHLGLAPFTYPAYSSIANELATARLSSGGRSTSPPRCTSATACCTAAPPSTARARSRSSGTCRGSRS